MEMSYMPLSLVGVVGALTVCDEELRYNQQIPMGKPQGAF